MEHEKSPSMRIWDAVEFARLRDCRSNADLAAIAGVTTNTVRNDRKHPEKIPLDRLFKYLSVSCDINSITDQILHLVLFGPQRRKVERKRTWE